MPSKGPIVSAYQPLIIVEVDAKKMQYFHLDLDKFDIVFSHDVPS